MDNQRKARVREYIAASKISQAAFARMIRISEGYLSRWLKGDLDNEENINKEVDNFFEKEMKRQEIKQEEDIPFAETGISKTILGTLDYCRLRRIIGCIYGDAGIGKTKTVAEWSKDKPDVYTVTATKVYMLI